MRSSIDETRIEGHGELPIRIGTDHSCVRIGSLLCLGVAEWSDQSDTNRASVCYRWLQEERREIFCCVVQFYPIV